jgi:hypothetical protein
MANPICAKQAQQIVQELNGKPCMRFLMPMGSVIVMADNAQALKEFREKFIDHEIVNSLHIGCPDPLAHH